MFSTRYRCSYVLRAEGARPGAAGRAGVGTNATEDMINDVHGLGRQEKGATQEELSTSFRPSEVGRLSEGPLVLPAQSPEVSGAPRGSELGKARKGWGREKRR